MSTGSVRGMATGMAAALILGTASTTSATVNTWQGTSTAWASDANWSEGIAPDATHDVVIDGGGTAQPTLNLSSASVTVKSLSIGANNPAILTFSNGNMDDKRLIVTGDVTIGPSGNITHTANSNAETHRLFLDVTGNLTIETGGMIDVQARGYGATQGPTGAASARGGAHGGQDQWGFGVTYGNYLAPINLGAGGPSAGGSGGGAIRISVGGVTTNNGLIRADGFVGGARGAAGGSVFLSTGRIAGSGSISAKGGYHTTASDYAGGGGRIAVILTTAGADFAEFPTTQIAAYGGKRPAAPTGAAAGTVYVQTGDQSAGEGTLIIDNGNQPSGMMTATAYYPTKAAIPAGQTWAVSNLVLRGHGCLGVESGTTLILNADPVGDGLNGRIALNGGQFTIPPVLSVTNWTLTVNGSNSVTGNVVIGGSATGRMNHWENRSTPASRINLNVDGNLAIETNGSINVVGLGFGRRQGPGQGAGAGNPTAGHGGRGVSADATRGRTYGDPIAPTTLGSGAHQAGSGAIQLTVSGNTAVNGPIDASGMVGNDWMGAGGSVFLTTGTLSGTNAIRANGGYRVPAGSSGSGGGRVAVILTGPDADFSNFTGPITAYGGWLGTVAAAGTVYLESALQGSGNGTLIVDNGGYATTQLTALDDISARTIGVGNVILRNQARFHVGEDDRIDISGVWSNAATFSAAVESVVAFTGATDGFLYGDTTFSELECTAAGKTLKFEAGKTFTVNHGLRFTGADGNLLRLESTAPEMQWNLTLPDGSVQRDISYVAASNSNASAGETIIAQSALDMGGNDNWFFTYPQPITWTGASNSAWNVNANWDLGRAPLPTDPRITVAVGANHPQLNASYSYEGHLIIDPSAILSLNGFNLAIGGTVTNQGAIVNTGSEILTVGGDIDFTGGVFSAAQGTLKLAGVTAQVFRPDGNAFHTLNIGTTQAVTVAGGFAAKSVTFSSISATARFESGFVATNLRCIVSDGAILTFAATSDVEIGALTLRGADGAPIMLRSTSDGSAWKLNVSGYAAVRYTDAKDSDARGGRTIYAVNSVNSSGNQNWDFGNGKVWLGTTADWSAGANWSPAGAPDETNHALIDGSAATAPVVGSAATIGGLTMANLSGFATLTVNAPFSSDGFLTVTGNVDIGTGATLVHARNDTAELYRIDLKVGGNLTVAVGGGIDVTAMGYGSGKGPGARGGGSGSHGGLGGYDSGYLLTYGSALAPTNLGSGGDAQSYGGGAIRLDVTGAAFVDGAFVADGQQGPARSGAGGSIYLTAGTLAGSGNIRANGGTHSTSAWAGGGGGRVAIILRQAGAEFGVFGGTIQARGGVNSAGNGAAGTVYLQTADEAAGAGVVMIDNVGLTTAAGVFTTIPAQKWPNAEELKHASVVVTNRGRLAVATNGVVDALAIASSTESLGLGEANTVLTVNSLTVHGIAYTRGGSYTVANNWNNHPGGVPSNVSGDGAIELWRPAGSLFLLR